MNKFNYAIIADTHFGARNNSKSIIEYQEYFFRDVFFPTLDEYNISTIIHLGDIFDKRKNIDFSILKSLESFFLNEIVKRQMNMILILGNHDTYYKSTIKVNSPQLLLKWYIDKGYVHIIDKPTLYEKESMLLIPWMAQDNWDECFKSITHYDSKYLFGHFEIVGCDMGNGRKCEHGLSKSIFSKYDKVFSGHFHKRQDFYVGSHIFINWNDYGQDKGFELFDSNTGNTKFIQNPKSLFKKIELTKDNIKDIDVSEYSKCYVKVLKNKDLTKQKYDKFIKKLEEIEPHEIKIIEDVDYLIFNSEIVVDESKSTLDIIEEQVYNSDIKDANEIVDLFKKIYLESMDKE